MRDKISIFSLAGIVLFVTSAPAADKAVIIPLGSGAKGSDKQVQYNDNGKTAGANVFYDKKTGNLEIQGEVKTTDPNGQTRIWGQGRLGTTINGEWYLNAEQNLYFAQSNVITTWGDAASACPEDTWVCTRDERGNTAVTVPSSWLYDCEGTGADNTEKFGWVADADYRHGGAIQGDGLWWPLWTCHTVPVWCCKAK